MSKGVSTNLPSLIKSLSPSEKRNFKIYASRTSANRIKRFMELFNLLERSPDSTDDLILKKIPSIKAEQLPNVKANLYRQLLSSLRNVGRQHEMDIRIREQLDYARVLYVKGMYKASLSMIEKTKQLAIEHGFFSSALACLSFEKFIETQYVTGSMYPKAKKVTEETADLMHKLDITHKLSNLSLSMYAMYLQYGHVQRGEKYETIRAFFKSKTKGFSMEHMDFYQRLYYHQSHVWYYFTIQDFLKNYRHSKKWVDLFEEFPEKKKHERVLYIKGLHNVLSALFMTQQYERFMNYFSMLESWADSKNKLNNNESNQLKLYLTIHSVHKIFLSGEFTQGLKELPDIESLIEHNPYQWDMHRIMAIAYKVASVYFGAGQLENSIDMLNKIIYHNYAQIREDLQCYSRILSLAAHYDLGNDMLVSYQVRSVYRFLLKMEQQNEVILEVLSFLRRTTFMIASEMKVEFAALRKKLIVLEEDPLKRRPFLYFDLISWLDSKINSTTVEEEVQKRVLSRN